MKWLQKIFSFLVSQWVSQYAMNRMRKKALLIYLKTLQAMRRSLMVAFLIFFSLQLMVFGFFGAIVAGVWLIPDLELSTRMIILFGIFGTFFLVPFVILLFCFSERTWFKMSGAEQLMPENQID